MHSLAIIRIGKQRVHNLPIFGTSADGRSSSGDVSAAHRVTPVRLCSALASVVQEYSLVHTKRALHCKMQYARRKGSKRPTHNKCCVSWFCLRRNGCNIRAAAYLNTWLAKAKYVCVFLSKSKDKELY